MVSMSPVSSPASRQELSYTIMESPVGPLLLAGDEQGLWVVSFVNGRRRAEPAEPWHESATGIVAEARRQLDAYFRRELKAFTVPVHLEGSEFQRRVWNALPTIPYGTTTSYSQLARQIGSPLAVRAVGAANGANPIAIILPCHRVVGSGGTLTGYGGGLANKATLLALERGDLLY